MKFTVSQSSLTQAIGVVMKGVASASTLPILSGVLVKAQDGILEFQTSNYTISIRHRIAAHVEEEGEMVIPCKMLSNITKTLPDAPVTFELSERQVLIGCEKSSFRLNTLDANDFPEFPAYAIESAVELPTDILSEMVGRVWRVTSTDKARPILGGVHMKVENNTVRLVATDSFRLAVCDTQVETSTLEGSFELNVPADAFNDALSIMASQATIMIGATDTQVVFEAGNTTYVSRRIEGVYPNYKQLIP
ncbi:DNA polymerase III subunit beta, partial [Collinsella aerofaciens]|uniref:DNA polymerase III subunit beta n=2 Tax=Coriobacteriaceae TaxID=84107 RepID=UPI0034A2718E